MEVAWTPAMFVSHQNTTRRPNPDDLDLKNHRRESLKTRKFDLDFKLIFITDKHNIKTEMLFEYID
jgi:hypothetical protein